MKDKLNFIFGGLTRSVIGSEKAARLLLLALVSEGHVLIQGAPGLGKTTLCKSLSDLLDCSFSRIQFTPDLLPADILGYSIFDKKENEKLKRKIKLLEKIDIEKMKMIKQLTEKK